MTSGAGPSESATLDAAELLSHRVELFDIRTRSAQRLRERLLLGEWHGFDGQWQQRGSTTGKQAQTHVARPQLAHDFQNLFRAFDAGLGRFIPAGRASSVER